jgi:hypothetical protein
MFGMAGMCGCTPAHPPLYTRNATLNLHTQHRPIIYLEAWVRPAQIRHMWDLPSIEICNNIIKFPWSLVPFSAVEGVFTNLFLETVQKNASVRQLSRSAVN